MTKKLLYIAYFYPPLGGAGVQRPVKTIKYLAQKGWDIDVLTVGDIEFNSYDYELLKESKANKIYRTASLDPMYLYKLLKLCFKNKTTNDITIKTDKDKLYFQTPEIIKQFIRGIFPIDNKIGWFPFAYKKAVNLCNKKKYNLIFATIGPFTSGYLAYRLSKVTKIPYFIDYRDQWSLYVYPLYFFNILKRHAESIEKKMLENACGVSFVGKFMKENILSYFGKHLESKIVVAYNGFDEDDFTIEVDKRNDNKIIIRYIGTLYGLQKPDFFIKALIEMIDLNTIPDNVCFEFIGNYYSETNELFSDLKLARYLKTRNQVSHPEAVALMKSSDALLLFLSSKNSTDVIPGKIFEYMRTGVPILAMISESSETAQILKDVGHNYFCSMEDIEMIKTKLNDLIKYLTLNIDKKTEVYNKDKICFYSRENQTLNLEAFICKLLNETNLR